MLVSFLLVSLLFAGKIVCYESFDEFEDDESFAESYLRKYHYISPARSGNQDLNKAIKNFQKFFHLSQTGELDEDTLYLMRKPRCGMPDVDEDGRVKRFTTQGKWSKTSLTYYMEYGNDMSEATQLRIIEEALDKWVGAASSLKFTWTDDYDNADIRISSGSKSHAGVTNEQDCNYAFDGEGGTLAHAYFPQDGRVHFDNDERYSENGGTTGWWWSEKVYQSLSYVALHEFGHTLGLGHSDNDDAVMWPYARTGNPSLHSDDISGIQSLYGS